MRPDEIIRLDVAIKTLQDVLLLENNSTNFSTIKFRDVLRLFVVLGDIRNKKNDLIKIYNSMDNHTNYYQN